MFDRLQHFLFRWGFLRVPYLFVVVKGGLHVRRKHNRKPRVNLERVPFSCSGVVPVYTALVLVFMLVFASYV